MERQIHTKRRRVTKTELIRIKGGKAEDKDTQRQMTTERQTQRDRNRHRMTEVSQRETDPERRREETRGQREASEPRKAEWEGRR